jgi:hypothetical protein
MAMGQPYKSSVFQNRDILHFVSFYGNRISVLNRKCGVEIIAGIDGTRGSPRRPASTTDLARAGLLNLS